MALASVSLPALAEGAISKSAERAGKFTEKTAKRAGKFVERTATKAGRAVERGAKKVEDKVKNAF